MFVASGAVAQTGSNPPSRAQAQYSRIYFDDVETVAPALGQGFILDTAGSLDSNPSEVISGKESIRGSYSGSGTYTPYLRTDPKVIPLTPNHSYQVTFQYKILAAPDKGFQVLFYSPTGGAGDFLPSVTVTGAPGATGTATLTKSLGPYSDYAARWDIPGTGAISIDNIQLIDAATGKAIATENAEQTAPGVASGLQLQNRASVVTGKSLVISGQASILLPAGGFIATVPQAIALGAHSTYIAEFDYRFVTGGPGNCSFFMSFVPPGPYNQRQSVTLFGPGPNASATGHFSSGALTNAAPSYIFSIISTPGCSAVIDNLALYLQSSVSTTRLPESWSRLRTRPFPRLGNYQLHTTPTLASNPINEPPLTYTLDKIESRLAFADVIVGLLVSSQTESPDSLRRLRQLNPDLIILPYRISAEQEATWAKPISSDTDPDYDFLQGLADQWYARETNGSYVQDPGFPDLRKMNISPFVPLYNGDTFTSYLLKWLDGTVFQSGVWDGIFLDNLFGRINEHILNFDDSGRLEYDWNLNRARDETPASSSDMTRQWALSFLSTLQSRTGGGQIVIGNAGTLPESVLAPYVNGYVFECFNGNWDFAYPLGSPAQWRQSLETYLSMEKVVREPKAVILEGCGHTDFSLPDSTLKTIPTDRDIKEHRFSIGTAMLGDGFYEWDLWHNQGAPYWFDEYSVDANGTAVEDRTKKGYLGGALTDAVELAGGSMLVYQQDFENGIPVSLSASPGNGIFLSQTPNQVISGKASLVISNPDHTRKAVFTANLGVRTTIALGSPALVKLKWRITQTLDGQYPRAGLRFHLSGKNPLDNWNANGVVTGDSGTVTIPVPAVDSSDLALSLDLSGGGGEAAIDDIQIYQGGVGPWRRDFENGFVLVNPFNQPHTFSAAELAGTLNRSGIKRIKGTQAPDVNNGQPVTGDLTLGAFDAVVLLADPIRFSPPAITGIASAASGQPGVASGAFVSIYGLNFTPLAFDDWSKSITDGHLPNQLDGISVTIGRKPAYINAITPGQINVQAPDVTAGAVDVIVTTPGGTSAAVTANSQVFSPAFFQWPGNQPVATHADYSFAVKDGTFPSITTVPVKPGEIIILWGTGFGPTNPVVAAGEEPPIQAHPTQAPVTATLGGTAVPVLGAALSSSAAEYQIAIQVPGSIADGDYPIVASVGGVQSPSSVLLTVHH